MISFLFGDVLYEQLTNMPNRCKHYLLVTAAQREAMFQHEVSVSSHFIFHENVANLPIYGKNNVGVKLPAN